MRTLVIDTATKACSVALFDDSALIAGSHEIIGRGHAERLLPLVAALPERGKADRILVDTGPGSFTGIRVGVAAAKALGFAWQAPVFGYNALDLVAAMARKQLGEAVAIDVVMTGGHGEYYHQYYDANGSASAAPVSIAPDMLATIIRSNIVAGDIAFPIASSRHLEILPDARCWHLISSSEALLPSPLYIRAPDAKLPQARVT
jgi:tRNA threonylcarbamoyladenosine biosynthesis protein TsaB